MQVIDLVPQIPDMKVVSTEWITTKKTTGQLEAGAVAQVRSDSEKYKEKHIA